MLSIWGSGCCRNDVKKAWLKAGVEGRHVALLVTDSQLIDEAFVEDLAGLLSSGEVRGAEGGGWCFVAVGPAQLPCMLVGLSLVSEDK